MTLAVFDIDGTLVTGSTERAFGRHLMRRGLIGPRQAAAHLLFLPRYLPRCGLHVLQKNKAYLTGLPSARLAAEAEAFVSEALEERWFEPAVARLRWHRERGDDVLLLSGTLEWLAHALARALGVSAVCATELDTREGYVASGFPRCHPFGKVKTQLLRAYAGEHGIDLADTYAYANSSQDLDLLLAVGTAVAVLPDRNLLRAAQSRGWEVIVDARGPVEASAAADFRI